MAYIFVGELMELYLQYRPFLSDNSQISFVSKIHSLQLPMLLVMNTTSQVLCCINKPMTYKETLHSKSALSKKNGTITPPTDYIIAPKAIIERYFKEKEQPLQYNRNRTTTYA